MLTIGLIIGSALYRQFDAATRTFVQPVLSVLYALVLAVIIFLIIKDLTVGKKE